MTDPNKLTVLTPGFDRATGAYADHGVPAPVVAQYLRENRIVPEKNDLNSLLFLLTPGVESARRARCSARLVAFKQLHDDNAPLEEVIRDFVRRRPARYCGRAPARPLRARCTPSTATATSARCSARSSRPSICRSGDAAARGGARSWCATTSTTCRSPRPMGRIATTLLWSIRRASPRIVPGERLDERRSPMLDYLKMFERSANLFPGFEAEIQGIYREVETDGTVRFHTYVVRE